MAQKEAVNTFTGGLVMDTHPLTTPNNVLTNCLNGTLVTFNGNEMILQNDMGNAIVKSDKNGDLVKLPEGFVPVGTAELGGIVYIASYNPETKECQLGSFPSPERNQTSSEGGLNDNTFQYSKLINNDSDSIEGIKALIKGSVRIDLTNKELHSGDKYLITISDKLDSCDFKLISVSEDGNIMNLNYNTERYTYYTAPNAGKLAMLISPKKLQSFSCSYSNLEKYGSYSIINNDNDYLDVDYFDTEEYNQHTYIGDYIKYHTATYEYYKLSGDNFIIDDNPSNPDDYSTILNTEFNEFLLIQNENTSQGTTLQYIFEDNQLTLINNTQEDPIDIDDKNIIIIQNGKFKVKTPKVERYTWINSGYNITLKCFWNDKDKENNSFSQLEKILIPSANSEERLYTVSNNSNSSEIILHNVQLNDGDKIKLEVYPVIKIQQASQQQSAIEGYIAELKQSIIIDPTLKPGEIKLELWKYYYNDNTVNLYYGLSGYLTENDNIQEIIFTALEYKNYQNDNEKNDNEKILFRLSDKESYLGSFYEKLKVGELLGYNKLYAITIEIKKQTSSIYEYRWLYTNDIFNDQFDSDILDYDALKISLNKFKCEVDIDNSDIPFEQTSDKVEKPVFKSVINESQNIGDYCSYGYTKTNYDDYIPYTFKYNTGNELFKFENTNKVFSEVQDITFTELISPYAETDQDRQVLNSYPGQASYTEPSYTIYSSPYAYKNFTDYIGITENDKEHNRFKFQGRIYNKIKGTINECVIDGGPIYTPLVYDRTTGENYNLTFSSDGKLVPKTYLCLEVFPYIRFYEKHIGGIGNCHSNWKGKLSLYFAKFNGSKLTRIQSYTDISSYYQSTNTSETININNIQNSSGENIVNKIITNLNDNGTKGFDIIPIVFTTIKGKSENVTSQSGNSKFYTSKADEGYFGEVNVKLDPSSIVNYSKIICSRNADNHNQNEFEIYEGGSIPATIGLLINNNLYIVENEFVDLADPSNHSVLAEKIFNLLAQIYIVNGTSGVKTYNCLKDFDYQKDCIFRLNIKGNIKTTISEQLIVDNYLSNGYYDDWTKNNLYIKEETKSYGFESYKLFQAIQSQEAIDEYKKQLESGVRSKLTPNTVKSYLSVSVPDSQNQNTTGFYILSKTGDNYELVNGPSPITLGFKFTNISLNSVYEYQYEVTEQSKSYILTFNGYRFGFNQSPTVSEIKFIEPVEGDSGNALYSVTVQNNSVTLTNKISSL